MWNGPVVVVKETYTAGLGEGGPLRGPQTGARLVRH